MPLSWALNGPSENPRPDLRVRNAFSLPQSSDRLYIKRGSQIFLFAWAGTQWAVSPYPSGVKIAASVNLFLIFPLHQSKKSPRYLSRWHFSNLQTFLLSSCDQDMFFFLFQVIFVQNEREWMCWKNVPGKCGPHKLPDGRGDAISLTTGQQKSSHALDKGA